MSNKLYSIFSLAYNSIIAILYLLISLEHTNIISLPRHIHEIYTNFFVEPCELKMPLSLMACHALGNAASLSRMIGSTSTSRKKIYGLS